MRTSTLVDTNVLIEILVPSELRNPWSLRMLRLRWENGSIVLNTIVWSEVALSVGSEDVLEQALSWLSPVRKFIPWSAAFAAGMAHGRYRKAGGARERTLPDFLIGAHDAYKGHALLTRDPARYRTYFPDLDLIAPDTHP